MCKTINLRRKRNTRKATCRSRRKRKNVEKNMISIDFENDEKKME